jgi:hypothetical protein
MGFNKNLNYFFVAILTFFLLITSTFPSPSSPHEIQPKALPAAAINVAPAEFRVFQLKNTHTFFLDKEEDLMSKKKKRISRRRIPVRKKTRNNRKARPFSVMLPKGFVPPSGSSPCHNEYPTSVSYCELSTTKP